MKRKLVKKIIITFGALITTILLIMIGIMLEKKYSFFTEIKSDKAIVYQNEISTEDVVKENINSLVTLSNSKENIGSGVIVDQDDEKIYILTNYHVISSDDGYSCSFFYNENKNEKYKYELIGYDEKVDIAIGGVNKTDISKEMLENVKIASFGNSDLTALGQKILVIGDALGQGQTVTSGIVSALNRKIESKNCDCIQIDAAINPGNSGGALFNLKGELIGIIVSKVTETNIDNVGYAIPANDAKQILENYVEHKSAKIVSKETRGALGIAGIDLEKSTVDNTITSIGVYVNGVEKEGAASKSGLKKGDIIIEFDNEEIENLSKLEKKVSCYSKGTKVNVKILQLLDNNSYCEKTIQVELGQYRDLVCSNC